MPPLAYMHWLQGGLCFYCLRDTWCPDYRESAQAGMLRLGLKTRRDLRRRAATREHLVRKADGGTNDPANIVMSCQECNGDRRTVPVLLHLAHKRNREHTAPPISAARVERELWKGRSVLLPTQTQQEAEHHEQRNESCDAEQGRSVQAGER